MLPVVWCSNYEIIFYKKIGNFLWLKTALSVIDATIGQTVIPMLPQKKKKKKKKKRGGRGILKPGVDLLNFFREGTYDPDFQTCWFGIYFNVKVGS